MKSKKKKFVLLEVNNTELWSKYEYFLRLKKKTFKVPFNEEKANPGAII